MSERIDHAARSRWRMERTLSSYGTGKDAGAIVVALAALNDATLALVEQQKITNLIALAALIDQPGTHELLSEAAYGALDVLIDTKLVPGGPAGDDEFSVLSADIATALGIAVQS